MPPSPDAEDSVFKAASDGFRRWLGKARDRVMAPWRKFQGPPNPQEVQALTPDWQAEVDRIADSLSPAIREGWGALKMPGDLPRSDPYVQANLAMTKNLLVRVPDEVHARIAREILTGKGAQETPAQIADRVENVLNYTGSENWEGRSHLIAQTESNRHYNSAMLAHALMLERGGRHGLQKQWNTKMDGRERLAHGDANGQVQPLQLPFVVGGEPLLFPVDPRGRPDNVIGCRCALRIKEGNP